jgi:hypothetical protein
VLSLSPLTVAQCLPIRFTGDWQRSWRWTSANKNDQGSKTVGSSNCKRPTSTLCPGWKQIDLNIGDSLPGGVQLNGMAASTVTLLSAILPSAVSCATWYLDQHSLSVGLSLAPLLACSLSPKLHQVLDGSWSSPCSAPLQESPHEHVTKNRTWT